MGRPRISDEERIATAVRLPASLRDRLQHAALQRDVSVNYLITKAVGDFLDHLPDLSVDDTLTTPGSGN